MKSDDAAFALVGDTPFVRSRLANYMPAYPPVVTADGDPQNLLAADVVEIVRTMLA